MRLGRSGLFAEHEPCPDPHGRGPVHERRGERLAVEDAAGGHGLDLLARERARAPLDHLHHGRDEDRGGHVARVAPTFAALRADHVHADVQALLHVLRVPDHVHVEDAGLVQPLHNRFRGHADGGDEEPGAAVDDDADELIQLALGVVVAAFMSDVFGEPPPERSAVLGLSCVASDLWDEQVDTERRILVLQKALQLLDLFPQHVRRVAGGHQTSTSATQQPTLTRHHQ